MGVSVGDRAPTVELVDHEGRPWSLSGRFGQTVVLIFHRHLR